MRRWRCDSYQLRMIADRQKGQFYDLRNHLRPNRKKKQSSKRVGCEEALEIWEGEASASNPTERPFPRWLELIDQH